MDRDFSAAARSMPPLPRWRGLALAASVAAVSASMDCTMGDSGTIGFVTNRADKGGGPKKPSKPCIGNAECPPPMPYCDGVTRTCIECLADPNCPGMRPFCGSGGWCVECIGDSSCAKGKPFCDVERGVCAECLADAHCDATKVCDLAERRCVPRCADDSTCEPMKSRCDLARSLCVECLSDAHCGDMKKPACGAYGQCVECSTSAHCTPERPICDPAESKCICQTDADCPAGRRCDPMRHCVL
jgi:hypothetical protein